MAESQLPGFLYRSQGRYRRTAMAFAILGFVSHLIIVSRMTEIFPQLFALRLASIAAVLISSAVGVALCFDPKKAGIGILSLILLLCIPAWVYIFNLRTSQSFTWAAGGNFYGVGLFGLFVVLTRQEGAIEQFLRIAFRISAGYIGLYLIVSILFSQGYIAVPDDSSLLIIADATSNRSARLVMATSHMVFVISVVLAHLRRKISVGHLLILAYALGALWQSQSRLLAFLIIAVGLAFVLTNRIRAMGLGAFVSFLLFTLVSLVIAFSDLNPFDVIDGDISASTRRRSIEIVHSTIDRYWAAGAGIAAGPDAYQPLSGVFFFYPADLGMIGQLYVFGLLGILMYWFMAYGACFSEKALDTLRVEPGVSIGLQLSGIILTLYSVLAPVFSGASGTLFGALFLALLPYSPLIGFWRPRARPAPARRSRSGSMV